jgi:hypothetical protein
LQGLPEYHTLTRKEVVETDHDRTEIETSMAQGVTWFILERR